MPVGRRGGLFVEILAAVVLFMFVFVPLLLGFRAGIRQTRAISSYVTAQTVAEWGLSHASALVVTGIPVAEEAIDLSADVLQQVDAASRLHDLRMVRTVESVQGSEHLYDIRVVVSWVDGVSMPRELVLRGLVRRDV